MTRRTILSALAGHWPATLLANPKPPKIRVYGSPVRGPFYGRIDGRDIEKFRKVALPDTHRYFIDATGNRAVYAVPHAYCDRFPNYQEITKADYERIAAGYRLFHLLIVPSRIHEADLPGEQLRSPGVYRYMEIQP